jgi:hypothetical protein
MFVSRPVSEPLVVDAFAQFAQYLLIICGIWWYAMRSVSRRRTARAAAS